MTTNRYFTLTNSTETLSKRFKVVLGGYSPIDDKGSSPKKTVDGDWDIPMGAIFQRHEYMVQVRGVEEDSNYGTRDDLAAFYRYNNPNPVSGPSNKIKFEDHFGNAFYVNLVGEFVPTPQTVFLEGSNAVFIFKITMLILNEEVESLS